MLLGFIGRDKSCTHRGGAHSTIARSWFWLGSGWSLDPFEGLLGGSLVAIPIHVQRRTIFKTEIQWQGEESKIQAVGKRLEKRDLNHQERTDAQGPEDPSCSSLLAARMGNRRSKQLPCMCVL
jgi:hypothetical protein